MPTQEWNLMGKSGTLFLSVLDLIFFCSMFYMFDGLSSRGQVEFDSRAQCRPALSLSSIRVNPGVVSLCVIAG